MDETTIREIRTTTPQGRACHYPDTAILTEDDVAEVLALSPRTVRGLPIPCYHASEGRCRYLYGDVVAYLKQRPAA